MKELLRMDTDENLLAEFAAMIAKLLAFADREGEMPSLDSLAIAEKRFSQGGFTAHRGYFCPSAVYDFIADNADRGVLTDDADMADYIYSFSADGRLLLVENRELFGAADDFCREYLFYFGDEIYGLFFDAKGRLTAVSRETYRDEQLVEYCRTLCYDREEADLYLERCQYEGERLKAATVYLGVAPDLGIYDECRYAFHHNEKGRVLGFTERRQVMGEEFVEEVVL